jgi:hypothetical protein
MNKIKGKKILCKVIHIKNIIKNKTFLLFLSFNLYKIYKKNYK